jgi:hypothetical protein
LLLPTQFALDLQHLGGIWIEARGSSLIAIPSQTTEENKNVGSRCEVRHRAKFEKYRRAGIHIPQ